VHDHGVVLHDVSVAEGRGPLQLMGSWP
jgi:hypothetical protein